MAKETTQWAKSPKNSLKECIFVNLAFKIYSAILSKYTPKDCFFGPLGIVYSINV